MPNQRGIALVPVLIVVTLLAVGVWYYLLVNVYQVNPSSLIPKNLSTNSTKLHLNDGQEATLSGQVVADHKFDLAATGKASFDLQTPTGQIEVVYNLGKADCPNTTAKNRGPHLMIGENVQVFGRFLAGALQTCPSTDYYIK